MPQAPRAAANEKERRRRRSVFFFSRPAPAIRPPLSTKTARIPQGRKWFRCLWFYKRLETTLAALDAVEKKRYVPVPSDSYGMDERRIWRATDADNRRYEVLNAVACINRCARAQGEGGRGPGGGDGRGGRGAELRCAHPRRGAFPTPAPRSPRL